MRGAIVEHSPVACQQSPPRRVRRHRAHSYVPPYRQRHALRQHTLQLGLPQISFLEHQCGPQRPYDRNVERETSVSWTASQQKPQVRVLSRSVCGVAEGCAVLGWVQLTTSKSRSMSVPMVSVNVCGVLVNGPISRLCNVCVEITAWPSYHVTR